MDQLIFFVFTIVIVGISILVRTGITKSWAILETLPGLLAPRMIYAAFPIALFLLAILLIQFVYPDFRLYDDLPYFVATSIIVLWAVSIFYFMWFPPWWIKPAWIRRWETEYDYALPIFVEEARKLGRWTWEKQVWKAEGMASWIDGVFEKRGEDLDSLWLLYKLHRVHEQVIGQKTDHILTDPYYYVGKTIERPFPHHRRHENRVFTPEDWAALKPLIFEEG